MTMLLALALAMQPGAACAALGRSVDQDPAGLNVRAAPSASAPVLGRLYSMEDPEAHHGGWPARIGPEFTIREVRDGWVRIEGADAVSEGVDGTRRNYTGAGWVSANLVEPIIVPDDISHPANRGYDRPQFDTLAVDPNGTTNIEQYGRVLRRSPRITACSGAWLELDYVRMGWLGPNGRWRAYPPRERGRVRAWFLSGRPAG